MVKAVNYNINNSEYVKHFVAGPINMGQSLDMLVKEEPIRNLAQLSCPQKRKYTRTSVVK